MQRGYVKNWRKSLDNPFFKKPLIWHFWNYCLLKATHKEIDVFANGSVVKIFPGQFIFGRKVASSETGLTERQIRTALKHLENLKNLTIQSTNKYSVITIINWDSYQSDDQQSDQQNDQVATKQRPGSDHIQEHKNIRNNNTSCPEPQNGSRPEGVIFEIPLTPKDGVFFVTEPDINQWQQTFPGIDVKYHMGVIRQWNIDNPQRRKTKTGIRRHISSWLAKEQNKAPQNTPPLSTRPATTPPKTPAQQIEDFMS